MERQIFKGQIARNYAETAFPQNFLTRKLGEITIFFAVKLQCLLIQNLVIIQLRVTQTTLSILNKTFTCRSYSL